MGDQSQYRIDQLIQRQLALQQKFRLYYKLLFQKRRSRALRERQERERQQQALRLQAIHRAQEQKKREEQERAQQELQRKKAEARRRRKRPRALSDTDTDVTPVKNQSLRLALKIVKDLARNKMAEPFLRPVELNKYGGDQKDYLRKIKRPMDLGTILKNLRGNRVYRSCEEVWADVRLVFDNCRTFNGPFSKFTLKANGLSQIFEERLLSFEAPSPPRRRPVNPYDSPSPSPKRLRKKAKTRRGEKRRRPSEDVITQQEHDDLREALHNCSTHQLQEISDILRDQNEGETNEDGTMSLKLEELSPSVFRAIEEYLSRVNLVESKKLKRLRVRQELDELEEAQEPTPPKRQKTKPPPAPQQRPPPTMESSRIPKHALESSRIPKHALESSRIPKHAPESSRIPKHAPKRRPPPPPQRPPPPPQNLGPPPSQRQRPAPVKRRPPSKSQLAKAPPDAVKRNTLSKLGPLTKADKMAKYEPDSDDDYASSSSSDDDEDLFDMASKTTGASKTAKASAPSTSIWSTTVKNDGGMSQAVLTKFSPPTSTSLQNSPVPSREILAMTKIPKMPKKVSPLRPAPPVAKEPPPKDDAVNQFEQV